MEPFIKDTLNLLPEVRWDRYAKANNQLDIYGWIRRDDKKYDFVLLRFFNGILDSYITSSAKYSKSIHERLGFTMSHKSCRRVEGLFPNQEVNCIHLKPVVIA